MWWQLLVAAEIKGQGRRKLLFACLPSLLLASPATLLLRHSLIDDKKKCFGGFQHSLGPGTLQNPWVPQSGSAETFSLTDWAKHVINMYGNVIMSANILFNESTLVIIVTTTTRVRGRERWHPKRGSQARDKITAKSPASWFSGLAGSADSSAPYSRNWTHRRFSCLGIQWLTHTVRCHRLSGVVDCNS